MRTGDVERDPPGELLREPHDDFVDVRIVDVRVELLRGDLCRGGRRHDRGLEHAVAVGVVLVRHGRSDGQTRREGDDIVAAIGLLVEPPKLARSTFRASSVIMYDRPARGPICVALSRSTLKNLVVPMHEVGANADVRSQARTWLPGILDV
jgi:hypothetical protein